MTLFISSLQNYEQITVVGTVSRDVNETLAYETETRPRPRPCKAETETFFKTFNLQHCAITMNGEPASVDVTNSSVTATAMFIIMKFIHHISIKT